MHSLGVTSELVDGVWNRIDNVINDILMFIDIHYNVCSVRMYLFILHWLFIAYGLLLGGEAELLIPFERLSFELPAVILVPLREGVCVDKVGSSGPFTQRAADIFSEVAPLHSALLCPALPSLA